MCRRGGVFALSCLAILLCHCQRELPRKARLPEPLSEASGVYRAGPDSLWWHNDSGDGPVLYLTDRRGKLRDTITLPDIPAKDWEDICGDTRGNLFIGDFGNNANTREDLHIWRFRPDNGALARIDFRFPDQTAFPPDPPDANFDCEAFFWYRDSLHLFSKSRLGTGVYKTRHYVLPDEPGDYEALLCDSLTLPKRVVTAAALSPDGQTVALLSYYFKIVLGIIPVTRTTVFLFRDFPDSHFLKGSVERIRVPKFIAPTQYEALDFYNDEYLVLGSEKTVLFHHKLRYVKYRKKGRSRP